MKKRKLTTECENHLNRLNHVAITTEPTGQTFFEIGNQITTDVAEAVATMMRINNIEDEIWLKEIPSQIDDVCPEKCLYWLTGGTKEWKNLENYRYSWSECALIFQEEFGFMVMRILKRSKKLKDVRDGFVKYLNLPTLYDFALSQDLIK